MAALREILVAFGITVDTKPIQEGNKAADSFKAKLQQLGGVIASAFAIDKIADFVTSTISAGDAIGDQAARLNLSSKALEEWTYAAKFADIQAGELDGIFNKLAKTSVAAGDASSDQGKVLEKLGVKVKNANGTFKDTGTLFEEVGLALGGLKDETERTSLSMTFFGKTAGPKVLQLFKDGPEGIRKFRAEFEALGGGMGDFVEQAGEIDDNMHRLDLAWTSAKVKIVGLFLPAVTLTVAALTKLSTFITYLSQHTNVLQAAFVTLGAIAAAKAGLMIASWWPVLLPFLKWALVIGAVVLAVEDLITAWQGGDSVIGRIIDRLFGAGATARTVAWIKSTGDAFATFWNDLTTRPDEFEANWLRTSASIKNDITGVLGPTLGGMVVSWIELWGVLIDTMTGGWTNFKDKFAAIGDGIGLAFKIVWTEIKFFGLEVVAALDDAVTSLLKKIPGGLGDKLAGSGTAVADLGKLRDSTRLALAAEGDDVGRRLNAPARGLVSTTPGSTVTAPINITNVLPAGTPANVVKAAGDASARGANKGVNRAAAAAFDRRGKK